MRLQRVGMVLTAATAAATAAGCSAAASYDERMEYLRKVAVRGAETHALIASSEGNPDKERCEKAHKSLVDGIPSDVRGGGISPEWREQVQAFFVDSCLSGKPKDLPPRGVPVSPAPVPSGPSVSPVSVPPSAVPSVTP